MTINASDDPRWLETYAVLVGVASDRLVDESLFREAGALDLWLWAAEQTGPFSSPETPWLTFTQNAPVWVVRRALPAWTGLLGLHPTPAAIVHRLIHEANVVRHFAEHACSEWDDLLVNGGDHPWPTMLSFVPRNGDWGSILEQTRSSWLDAPGNFKLERLPTNRPNHSGRTPRRLRRR